MNIYIDKSSWNISKYSNPFPFAEIDNFIKLDVYKEVKENFPSLVEFKKNGDINANNIGIRITYKELYSDKKSFWYNFGSHFVNESFFYNYCDFFDEEIKLCYPKIYKKIKNKNLKIGVSGLDNLENFDILLDFQLGINTPVLADKSVRGPHLDNQKEFYAGLCYLKDDDDHTESGHFLIFKKKPFRILKKGKGRSFDKSNLRNIKIIKYKSNKLATFINTTKSIHGVSKREVTKKTRKFFVFNAVLNEKLIETQLFDRILNRFNIYV